MARYKNYDYDQMKMIPVGALNDNDRAQLTKIVKREAGISVNGEGLDVTQEFLIRWLSIIEGIIRSLMEYIEERYEWK